MQFTCRNLPTPLHLFTIALAVGWDYFSYFYQNNLYEPKATCPKLYNDS